MSLTAIACGGISLPHIAAPYFLRVTDDVLQVVTPLFVWGFEVDYPMLAAYDIMTVPTVVSVGVNASDVDYPYVITAGIDYKGKLHEGHGSRLPEQGIVPKDWLFIETGVWAELISIEMIQVIGIDNTTVFIVTSHRTYILDCELPEAAKVAGHILGKPLPMHFTAIPKEAYWDAAPLRVYVKGVRVQERKLTSSVMDGLKKAVDFREVTAHRKSHAEWNAGQGKIPKEPGAEHSR